MKQDLFVFTTEAQGRGPVGGLIFDGAGNLYGVAEEGGTSGCPFGCGVVFKLSPGVNGTWTETVLYPFAGKSDGSKPQAGLIFDDEGNLYGTTAYGGLDYVQCGNSGCGTVFAISPGTGGSWNEILLHKFSAGADGFRPMAELIFDTAGNLFGTTLYGGAPGPSLCSPWHCGTVFELSPSSSGWMESVVLAFNGPNGAWPKSDLIFDPAGNLYGTTQGGTMNYNGNVFELAPKGGSWNETVLYSFPYQGNAKPGNLPAAGVIRDAAGNLYGTTLGGGFSTSGVVFEIVP
jgi:hypothetical protein